MRRGLRGAGEDAPGGAARDASARDGAVCSSAQASRWRATGRCTSQQLTVQKRSAVRFRLQVETLHVKYAAPYSIGFLHALHFRQKSDTPPLPPQP